MDCGQTPRSLPVRPENPSCVAEDANESWDSSSPADGPVGEDTARSAQQRTIFNTPQNGQTLAGYGDCALIGKRSISGRVKRSPSPIRPQSVHPVSDCRTIEGLDTA